MQPKPGFIWVIFDLLHDEGDLAHYVWWFSTKKEALAALREHRKSYEDGDPYLSKPRRVWVYPEAGSRKRATKKRLV